MGDSNIVLRFFGWVDQSRTDFLKGRSLALDAAKRALEGAGFALPEPIYRLRFDETAPLPLQGKGTRSTTAKPKPQVPKAAERTAGDAAPDAHVAKLVEEERAGKADGDLLDDRRPIE
ncbi:hypothetical protein BSL82_16070 [Tardibacter chloracetimidivorans]|uniref:Uncharacterized protein n=1 Tax=Tardibacter chloracetimidivorans TaxID=1921510 RepID=A0A1L3ZYB7_9SPHN|nr:hypothetical protein [Tardibacter chloracetimidivorans]API60617.1 hypothetical protein BSL82_16070 [Tardibacter chloracetimidivorans]